MIAKDEFVEFVADKPKVLCALLEDIYYPNDTQEKWLLRVGYSDKEYIDFLESIDREYNDGYGSQELGGTIWFVDGTYADRGEYDGSEWWEYHKAPEIPPELAAPSPNTEQEEKK